MSKGPGAPRKAVDVKLIEDLASIGCSLSEISSIVNLDKSNLSRTYGDIIERGQSNMKARLRRKQIQVAIDEGHPTMLIWLGKVLLGQEDKRVETRAYVNTTPEDTLQNAEDKMQGFEERRNARK